MCPMNEKQKHLEKEALIELRAHLEELPTMDPLQRYVHERFLEAGADSRERMRVMMELIRFHVYLETLPEYQDFKAYLEELEAQEAA